MKGVCMGDSIRRKPGINLLIFLYCLLIYQYFMHLTTSGIETADVFFSMFVIAILVFLIFGFLKRINISRIMAMVFHILYQLSIFPSFLSTYNTNLITNLYKERIKDIPSSGMIVLMKSILIFKMIGFSVINIIAIVYLIRNKEYFLKKEDERIK